MPARRLQSLRHGSAANEPGVVWHREHRTSKTRTKNYTAKRRWRLMRADRERILKKRDKRRGEDD